MQASSGRYLVLSVAKARPHAVRNDGEICKECLESQATIEAMAFDGVKRETVKTFVLDKKMKLKKSDA